MFDIHSIIGMEYEDMLGTWEVLNYCDDLAIVRHIITGQEFCVPLKLVLYYLITQGD